MPSVPSVSFQLSIASSHRLPVVGGGLTHYMGLRNGSGDWLLQGGEMCFIFTSKKQKVEQKPFATEILMLSW